MCNSNENDKKIEDPDDITTYPNESNFTLTKYFNDTNVTNSIEDLQEISKEFTESV